MKKGETFSCIRQPLAYYGGVMKTQNTQIKLRNKLTGLYFAEGKSSGFSATKNEATIVQRGSAPHRFIRFVFGADKFDTIEEVSAHNSDERMSREEADCWIAQAKILAGGSRGQ
jgi:hypothetical protein